MSKEIKTVTKATAEQLKLRKDFYDLFKACPIPETEMLENLGLFINRQSLARILFMHELYRKIVDVHGIVVEFGARWGQNLALFESFRAMYEPYNRTRKIVGFDTFDGFTQPDAKDGHSEIMQEGAYSVSENYESYLNKVLQYHENENPLSNFKKFELIKGDAAETFERYLRNNPETIVAFAYFDFDIYQPTKQCLNLIKDRLTKGSILAFDELNHPDFPGETVAFMEVFGLNKYKIVRSPNSHIASYITIE